MNEKKSFPPLLMSLLASMLEEWGYDTVRQGLTEARARADKGDPHRPAPGHSSAKPHARPTAVQVVERLDITAGKKQHLRAIATKFDTKKFLPSASDVRHFLEMHGEASSTIKQRQDAFRKVVSVLLGMADDDLRLLETSSSHAGPTQLGPLSDAIKAHGAAVRKPEPPAQAAGGEESDEPRKEPSDGSSVDS